MPTDSSLPDSCPDEETLRFVWKGVLPLEETEACLSHVEQCERCAGRLDLIAGQEQGPGLESLFSSATERAPATQSVTRRGSDSVTLLRDLLARTEAAHFDLGYLPPSPDPNMLARLGLYDLRRIIGSGGMGVVFEALDLVSGKTCALKTLKPGLLGRRDLAIRFVREAAATLKVDHPGIVPVLDHGIERGLPFIVMPLLEGFSFERLIKVKAPLPAAEAVRLTGRVAEALEAAHAAGILHRDIKPSNLWLDRGDEREARVYLLDFGLARMEDQATPLTQADSLLGTPAYLPPEWWDGSGRGASPASDVFSLGCVLYELLTGKRVFPGANTMETLSNMTRFRIRPPSALQPGIPPRLEGLVLRMLARDPRARPQTAGELARRLQDPALLGSPPLSRRQMMAAGTGLVVAGGAWLAWSTLRLGRKSAPPLASLPQLAPFQKLDTHGASFFALGDCLGPEGYGPHLAWIDSQGNLLLRNINQEKVTRLAQLAEPVCAIALGKNSLAVATADGQLRFANFSENGSTRLVNWDAGIAVASPVSSPTSAILYDPARSTYHAAHDGLVLSWDPVGGTPFSEVVLSEEYRVTTLIRIPPTSIAPGRFAATLSNGMLVLLDNNLQERRETLMSAVPLDFRLAVRANNTAAAVLGSDGLLCERQLPDFRPISPLFKTRWSAPQGTGPASPLGLAYCVGRSLAILAAMDGVVSAALFDMDAGREVAVFSVPRPVQLAAQARDVWILDESGFLHHFLLDLKV